GPDNVRFRHRTKRTKHLLQRRCEKRSDCDGCRHYLIEREMINARHHVWAAVRAGKTIYVGWCWPHEWDARYRKLRRDDLRLGRETAEYLNCRDRGDEDRLGCLLVSTEPFTNSIVSRP